MGRPFIMADDGGHHARGTGMAMEDPESLMERRKKLKPSFRVQVGLRERAG